MKHHPTTALILVLGAAVAWSAAPRSQEPPAGSTLSVFFTGDHDGEIESCGCLDGDIGGVTRLASFLDAMRKSGREFVLLEVGDLPPFRGMDSRGHLKTQTLARSMAVMGYDAVSLGDLDLAPGSAFVADLVGWLGQPILATNYELPPPAQSVRERRLEVGGKTVGVLAFLAEGLAGDSLSWVSVEPWETQRERVSTLRAETDFLIALAHVPDTTQAGRLARLYPEIDLVLMAHKGKVSLPIHQWGATWFMGCGSLGRYLGWAEVAMDEENRVLDVRAGYLPIEVGWGRQPEVDSLLIQYNTKMRTLVMAKAFQNERLQSLREPEIEFVGNQACASCHGPETEQWSRTAHAHSHRTLARQDQDHDPACQPCHTTGFGFRSGFATPDATPGMWEVGCEACHGAGAAHVTDPETPYGAVEEARCVRCHDSEQSPDFVYELYLPRIAHSAPSETPTEGNQ